MIAPVPGHCLLVTFTLNNLLFISIFLGLYDMISNCFSPVNDINTR